MNDEGLMGNNGKDEELKWKRLYDSLTVRCLQLEKNLIEYKSANNFLVKGLESAQKVVDLNKNILRQGFTEFNKKEQIYIETINKMKAKLKELGCGNFDFLGN